MDYFAREFDKKIKNDLINAIKELSKFAEKYKFDYVLIDFRLIIKITR